MTLPLPYVLDDPALQGNFDQIALQFPLHTGNLRNVMGPVTNVKDYGAKGDAGTTDNTTAIQAAIDSLGANGGTIFFPYGSYHYSGALDFDSTRSIVLKGVGGLSTGAATGSSLIFTGTGTGRAISARSTLGFAAEDIWLGYTSTSFTGTLLDFGYIDRDTQNPTLTRCLIGGSTPQRTALLMDLDKAINGAFTACNFQGGDVGVRGKATSGSYSNSHVFTGCTFSQNKTINVKNAGQAWTFLGGSQQQLYTGSGSGTSAGAGAYTSDTGFSANGLTFQGVWFGDATATGTWINFAEGSSGLNVHGCYIAGGATGIALPATGGGRGISITGNTFGTITTAFDTGSDNRFIDYFANAFIGTITNQVVYGATKPLGSRIHTESGGDIDIGSSLDLKNPALITLAERTDPSAPAANEGHFYLRDNGAGKTQLVVRFPTGAIQVLSTEP